MFDFLIKYPISIFEIKEFLAAALNIATSQAKQIACYVPNDNWNGYLLTGSSPTPIQVYEDEEVAEENKYIFTNAI